MRINKRKAAMDEIKSIESQIEALHARRDDLVAFVRIEATIGKDEAAQEDSAASEKRTRAPSATTVAVSDTCRGLLELVGPMQTKDLFNGLPPAILEMLGNGDRERLQRLSQILSREGKRGKFTFSVKEGWNVRKQDNIVPIKAA